MTDDFIFNYEPYTRADVSCLTIGRKLDSGVEVDAVLHGATADKVNKALSIAKAVEEAKEVLQGLVWSPIESAPDDTAYIGRIGHGEPFLCEYDGIEDGHVCVRQTDILKHRPTHWMPLPTDEQQQALKKLIEMVG